MRRAVASAGAAALAALIALTASAGAGAAGWTAPGVLSTCPASGAPQVVFPSDGPADATGPGAVVWSASSECAGGEGVRVAEIGAGEVPAVGGAQRGPDLRGAALAARAPHGKILIAGVAPAGAGAGEQLAEGTAAGPFASLGGSGGPPRSIALTSGYLGDVALLAPAPAPGGAGGLPLRLRVQRYYAAGFGPWVEVGGGGAGALGSVTSAMDYRSDVLAVWWQGGAIDAREMPATGVPQAPQRLAGAATEPQITALLSDDDHGIVAWSERRLDQTSVYLDISGAGVRFGTPQLLERFADPAGGPPASSVRLVRLSSESVLLAWAGAEAGRWVLRAATIELGGPGPISTLAAPAGGDALLAGLATGPDNEALALWSEPQAPALPAAPTPADGALFAASVTYAYPAGPIFGAAEELAPPGGYTDATAAIDPHSARALAVWRAQPGSLEFSIGPPRPR